MIINPGTNTLPVQMTLDTTPIQSLTVTDLSGGNYRFTSNFYITAGGPALRHLQWDLRDGLGVIGDQNGVEGPAAFLNNGWWTNGEVSEQSASINIFDWGFATLPTRIRVRMWDGIMNPGLIATTLLSDRWFDV